jgi:hypothetical protein
MPKKILGFLGFLYLTALSARAAKKSPALQISVVGQNIVIT